MGIKKSLDVIGDATHIQENTSLAGSREARSAGMQNFVELVVGSLQVEAELAGLCLVQLLARLQYVGNAGRNRGQ